MSPAGNAELTDAAEVEESITVVHFGDGMVGVGLLRLGADLCLTLSELDYPRRIGDAVEDSGSLECVRLHFTSTRSVDVVLRQLRARRGYLAHQCRDCGQPMETCGDVCQSCANESAARLAEPGSRVEHGLAFLRDYDHILASKAKESE